MIEYPWIEHQFEYMSMTGVVNVLERCLRKEKIVNAYFARIENIYAMKDLNKSGIILIHKHGRRDIDHTVTYSKTDKTLLYVGILTALTKMEKL